MSQLPSTVLIQLASGILGVNGDLQLDPGSILEVQLNNAIAGTGHSQIDFGGIFGFNGSGTVTVAGAVIEATVGPDVSIGQNYRVINNDETDPINGLIAVPGPFLLAAPTGQALSVNHAGGLLNNDLVLKLLNTATKAPDLALNETEIDEGGFVTATGALVDPDPGDKLTLIVNWGDGSRLEELRPGREHFTLRHRYRDNGEYHPLFTWFDNRGQGNSREFTVNVSNVVPTVFAGGPALLLHHGNLVRLGDFVDPGRDAWTATVDFGDGTGPEPLRLHDYRFMLHHPYRQLGTYTVKVTVRDDDGGVGTDRFDVTVRKLGRKNDFERQSLDWLLENEFGNASQKNGKVNELNNIVEFDVYDLAMSSIMAQRQRTDQPHTLRPAHLPNGSGPNDSVLFKARGPDAAVLGDGTDSVLIRNAGSDWYFANLDAGVLDKFTDLSDEELAEDFDFRYDSKSYIAT